MVDVSELLSTDVYIVPSPTYDWGSRPLVGRTVPPFPSLSDENRGENVSGGGRRTWLIHSDTHPKIHRYETSLGCVNRLTVNYTRPFCLLDPKREPKRWWFDTEPLSKSGTRE